MKKDFSFCFFFVKIMIFSISIKEKSMPKPVDTLWAALKSNQYELAIKIITDNPKEDLVNSLSPAGTMTVIARVCSVTPCPTQLLKYVADHSQFKLQYQNPKNKDTNVKCILNAGDRDIFVLFENNNDIIFNGDELSYQFAQKRLSDVTDSHQAAFKKNQHSDATKHFAKKMEGFKHILATLREKTIRFAVETDDPTILAKLEKAGCDLDSPLRDGYKPASITKKTDVKTTAWFAERQKSATSAVKLSDNDNTFDLFKALQAIKDGEQRLKTLTEKHESKQSHLYAKAADAGVKDLESALAVLSA
jgi:hypothetical protein